MKHDLKISLLERLHLTYTECLTDISMTHIATLITNYRCSHALLSLPSYLFYDSSLITAAKCSHLEAEYPLHFLCSSLDKGVLKEKDDQRYHYEADLLLKHLDEYRQRQGWGETVLKEVCIMASTAYQVMKYTLYLCATMLYLI